MTIDMNSVENRRVNYWKDESFPKNGWLYRSYEPVEDLKRRHGDIDRYEDCEVCGKEKIRFVHCIYHKDYGDNHIFRVGCICAGKLTGSIHRSKQLEQDKKSVAAMRDRWCDRKWKLSAKGNRYIKVKRKSEEIIFTIFKTRYGAYGFTIVITYFGKAHNDSEFSENIGYRMESNTFKNEEWYKNINDAKLAAFDRVF